MIVISLTMSIMKNHFCCIKYITGIKQNQTNRKKLIFLKYKLHKNNFLPYQTIEIIHKNTPRIYKIQIQTFTP